MANHVDGYLSIDTNEAGKKVWQGIIDKLDAIREQEGESWGEVHLGQLFFDDFEDPEFTRNWMCDNIGAKWAYARDWDEDGMSMYSAWSPCGEFAEWVIKEIGKVDPDATGVLTYEDEFPNYVGACTFTAEGQDCDNCIEWDEISELCRNQNEELAALWDEEAEDWTDEDAARDILCDIQYDVIHEWQANNTEWYTR